MSKLEGAYPMLKDEIARAKRIRDLGLDKILPPYRHKSPPVVREIESYLKQLVEDSKNDSGGNSGVRYSRTLKERIDWAKRVRKYGLDKTLPVYQFKSPPTVHEIEDYLPKPKKPEHETPTGD